MPAETRVGLFASVRHALRNQEMVKQAKDRLRETTTDYELERLSEEQRERERRARRARWGL